MILVMKSSDKWYISMKWWHEKWKVDVNNYINHPANDDNNEKLSVMAMLAMAIPLIAMLRAAAAIMASIIKQIKLQI